MSDLALWLVLDQRGILDRDAGVVMSTGESRAEAIEDCRMFGGGCVYGPDGCLTFWLDGDEEWNAEDEAREVSS